MIIIIKFKQLLEIRILIELAVGCCQLLFYSKMAAIEVQHLILFLLIVLVYCSLYVFADEKLCQTSKAGSNVDFRCPCLTGVGSFSRRNEKGTIWSNGIVAKNLRDRISYINQTVSIKPVVVGDAGEYIWVCDESYWESTVCLKIIVEVHSEFLKHTTPAPVEWIVVVVIGGLICLTIIALVSLWLYTKCSLKGERYRLNLNEGTISNILDFGTESRQWDYKRVPDLSGSSELYINALSNAPRQEKNQFSCILQTPVYSIV